jgi:hypothetical protein
MDRIKTVEFGGRKIEYVDYTHLKGDEYVQTVQQVTSHFTRPGLPSDKSILMLVDVTDSTITQPVLDAMRESVKGLGNHVKAMAVVGVTGLKKVFLDIVNAVSSEEIKAFGTLDEAKNWLGLK